MARRVDVHAHFLPAPYVEAFLARESPPRLVREEGRLVLDFGGGGRFPLHPEIADLDAHLASAAAAGVDAEVLSLIPPGVEDLEPAEALAVAQATNDWLAELSAARPERVRGVALVPAGQPEAAAEELLRAAGNGLRGASLLTNVRGARLDEERFRPIFAAAAEARVPILLHPAPPAHPDPFVEYGLMTTVGFPVETTLTVVRLVLSGLFERHPDLALVAPHVGATIPYLLGRIDYECERYGVGADLLAAPPSEHLRRVYLDTVAPSPEPIGLALELWGDERLLFGTDTPFWERERCIGALEAAAPAGRARDTVFAGNADRLFGFAA